MFWYKSNCKLLREDYMFRNLFVFSLTLMMAIILGSCSNTSEPQSSNGDIPKDPEGINVPDLIKNNLVPAATFTKTDGNESRIKVNLLGLVDPSTLEPIDLYADYGDGLYNFYLEEDGLVKGVKLTKVSSNTQLKADIIFTVDNSGSMSEEADSVAARIVDFADFLSQQGLDAQFGCVGYDGWVNGGLNLSDHEILETYLNDRYWSVYGGTYRTYGFYGPDSANLEEVANTYFADVWGENGVVAVLYADSIFSWRPGAQRVFINFTDEPTQPGGYYEWSTAAMCEKILGSATVHTVFSEDTTYYEGFWEDLYDERPWEMSTCTGGTMKFVNSDASDLNLLDLPVTGALSNSYLVEYMTSGSAGAHTVVITVSTSTADGKIEYVDISY
jgi:hypothetical protein